MNKKEFVECMQKMYEIAEKIEEKELTKTQKEEFYVFVTGIQVILAAKDGHKYSIEGLHKDFDRVVDKYWGDM